MANVVHFSGGAAYAAFLIPAQTSRVNNTEWWIKNHSFPSCRGGFPA